MQAARTFGRRGEAPRPYHFAPAGPAPRPVAPLEAVTQKSLLQRLPYLSAGMICLFAIIFLLEQSFAFENLGGPSYRSLMAMGGVDRQLIQEGEWWRLLTAPMLHGTAAHIIGNSIALILAGFVMEDLIGRGWFSATFVVGALCGSLASVFLGSSSVVSVGASGGVMSLLGAVFACSFHSEAVDRSARMRMLSLRMAVPALLPMAIPGASTGVDYYAHFGGVAAGLVIGFVLQILWLDGTPLPPWRRTAAAIGALGGAAAAIGFLLVAQHMPVYAARNAALMPDSQFKAASARPEAELAELTTAYPHDPRTRMLYALALIRRGDVDGAEPQLLTAMAERGALTKDLPAAVELSLRSLLGLTLVGHGRLDEAKAIAGPFCAANLRTQGFQKARASLAALKVCP